MTPTADLAEQVVAARIMASAVKLDKPEVKTFQADLVAKLWEMYLENRAKIKELEQWNKTFEGQLAVLSGDAESYTIAGKEIAVHRRDGQFVKGLFQKEQPDLWRDFTRLMEVEQFDEAAFKLEHPKLHALYRAKRFCSK